MDRAPPHRARRPMAPLAVVSTVAAPAPRRERMAHPGAVLVASILAVAAVALNSPLLEALGLPDEGSWRFIALWAEGGCVLAALGMAFRLPVLAWLGAGAYFAVSLAMAFVVWPAHLGSLLLLASVAAWQVRASRDRPERPPAWMPA